MKNTSMKPLFFYIIIFLLNSSIIFAQNSFLDSSKTGIGDSCPQFLLRDVDDYVKPVVQLKDFKGKWLVIDFWSKHCTSCVQSFPKINSLQKKYRDKVQFLLVGNNSREYNGGIEKMYKKFQVKMKLELLAAYDTLLFKIFKIETTPRIVIIDPNGIIFSFLKTTDLTESYIGDLLHSDYRSIKNNDNNLVDSGGVESYYGQYSNKDTSLPYVSKLLKWNPGKPFSIFTRVEQFNGSGENKSNGISLSRLYMLAYLGKTDWDFDDSLYNIYYRTPELRLKNKELFYKGEGTQNQLYNYSIEVPKDKFSKAYLMKALQNDLKRRFNYKVSIKQEKRRCEKLTVRQGMTGGLITKGGATGFSGDYAGMSFKNIPVSELLKIIWSYHQDGPVLIDATGIKDNIDIDLDALMVEEDDIKKALYAKGLMLINTERIFKCVVISD